jgi:ADP-ribose pyrophosphatase YjhB (NUDIX family)
MGMLTGWRHCPLCASALEQREGRVRCAECGFALYAHSVPAVAAYVVDDDRQVLLARRAREPDAGLWDAPGGFVEEGEDALEALHRELLEETGLTVEPGAFVGTFVDTYGDGPDAISVLNLVWEAAIVAGDPVASDDVSELGWFPPDALPPDTDLAFRWLARSLRAWAGTT